jgi:hypothetical protein
VSFRDSRRALWDPLSGMGHAVSRGRRGAARGARAGAAGCGAGRRGGRGRGGRYAKSVRQPSTANPGEHRALHAHDVLGDALERDRVTEDVLVGLPHAARPHHHAELVDRRLQLRRGHSGRQPRQHGCRRLRDTAARAAPRERRHPLCPWLHRDLEGDLITAGGIAFETLGIRVSSSPKPVRCFEWSRITCWYKAVEETAHEVSPSTDGPRRRRPGSGRPRRWSCRGTRWRG